MNQSAVRATGHVIQVDSISKSFGEVRAVVDLSFKVDRGEIFGFLGPNGAGKTTTLSILEGLLGADTGDVRILGADIRTQTRAVKQRIGVQLQTTSLLPDLTVSEQIRLFARLYGYQLDPDGIRLLLDQVGLLGKLSVPPEHLSGGQRQRLALALALINQPEIVFLDEPTTGLDPQSRRALWDIIRDLRQQGKTVVLTTHYMEEAEALCDRVGIIDHGQLIALDTPSALVDRLSTSSLITTSAQLPAVKLRETPSILGVHKDNGLLQVQTNDVVSALRHILDTAERENLRLRELHIKEPNLEDVFLHLTGHRIRA